MVSDVLESPALWLTPARPDPGSSHKYGVVDGDTFDLVVDVGYYGRRMVVFRLLDVDTAEVYGVSHDSEEYERGLEHSGFVRQWVEEALERGGEWPFVVRSEERDSLGRWLGYLWRRSDEGEDTWESLNAALLEEFDDVEYD